MNLSIREWRIGDKTALAQNLNNPKVLNNLRDGLPYPYTEKDAEVTMKEALIIIDVQNDYFPGGSSSNITRTVFWMYEELPAPKKKKYLIPVKRSMNNEVLSDE